MIKRVITTVPLVGVLFILNACGGSSDAPNVPSAPAVGAEQPASPPAPTTTPPVDNAAATPPARTTQNTTTQPPTGPSQFVVSDMKISPNGVRLGELTTVTAKVTNIGKTEATYSAVLRATPAWATARVIILPAANQDVNLAAGESKIINFQVSMMGNGYCIVQIEDQADRFTVDSQI